jgi:cellulose synthase operon protein B
MLAAAYLTAALAGLASSLSASPAAAGPVRLVSQSGTPSATTVSFAALGWNTQSVSGANPTIDLFPPGPGAVMLGPNSTLVLTYSASPILDLSQSSLTVFVNNVLVSGRVLGASAGKPTTLTATIPANVLVANGTNHLQISFGLRDTLHQVCGFSDAALNVTVFDSSHLAYDVRGPAAAPITRDLALLPAPFVTLGGSAPALMTAGMPAVPSTTELTGMARVLARLGEDVPTAPPAITTAPAEALPRQAPGTDLLLIGTPADNAALSAIHTTAPIALRSGTWQDAQGRSLPADEGIILEAANPWDARHTALVLTGNGPEGVRRAAMMLGSATLRRLLHGPYALLTRAPLAPPTSTIAADATLAERGYSNIILEGLGEHSARYSFDLTHVPSTGATLTLVYGHSDTVDSPLSSVRIDLNGQPVASRHLQSSDPARARWQVSLPSDVLHVGTNVLNARFFLQAPGADCQNPPYSSLWAAIDATSSIAIAPQGGNGPADLSLLPFPLLRDGDPAGTVLVIPARTERARDALGVAALIGARSRVDAPALTALADSAATPALLAGHTVVADGLGPDNRIVIQIVAALQARNGTTQALLQLGGQAMRQQGVLGNVVESISPWDAGQTALAITAPNAALLPAARHAAFSDTLSGTFATVDAAGHVQSFDMRSAAGAPAVANDSVSPRPILPLALLGVALIALVGAGASIRRIRAAR